METIGNRIKKKRKERGFNQEELAKVVNKSKQVISNWERGYSKPVDDDLLSLALALDVSSDYLLGLKLKEPSIEETKLEGYAKRMAELVRMAKNEEQAKKILDLAEDYFKK